MSFTIGSQNAANINNVQGDMIVGEIRAEAHWSPDRLRVALEEVERVLGGLGARPETKTAARETLLQAAREARPSGSPHRAASRLAAPTRLLADTGALASAGSGLVRALRAAAAALGPAGAAVLSLIPAL